MASWQKETIDAINRLKFVNGRDFELFIDLLKREKINHERPLSGTIYLNDNNLLREIIGGDKVLSRLIEAIESPEKSPIFQETNGRKE